jgi:glutamyl-tRNA reductase
MSPQIQCLGLSHKTAEVSLREKLNNLEHELLYQASSLPGSAPIDEIAVVSTCNRIEIYVVSEAKAFGLLKRLILNNCDVGAEELEQSKYSLTGLQVASHLLRVSAGLDSMVLGEPQILGQVTEAYERALQAGTVGKILSRLFQISIHAGKRVHTETHIGREAVSIPSVAAGLVNQHYKNLDDVRITLLGAGEMADLAVEALRKRGATRLHIVSRTLASACKLADRWEGQASTFDALTEVLREMSCAADRIPRW